MQLLTAQEAAELLHLHPKRVQTLARSGRLPAVRIGRKWLFERERLLAALRSGSGVGSKDEPHHERFSELGDRELTLSARNQLRGRVVALTADGVMAEVRIRIGEQELVSVITRASAERLGLRIGSDVLAVIKATEILVARSPVDGASGAARERDA